MKQLFIIILLIHSLPSLGQENIHLSMEEAVKYGLENHTSIQMAANNIEYYERNTVIKKSAYLPEIISSADYRNNLALPVTILPGDIFGRAEGPVEIKMGTRHNLQSGINIHQTLFNAAISSTIRQAGIEEKMAANNLSTTRKNIAMEIRSAYLLCLYNLELLQIIKNNVDTYAMLAGAASVKHENGLSSDSELEDALNREETGKLELRIKRGRYDNSIRQLKLKMDYPSDKDIILSDSTLQDIVCNRSLMEKAHDIRRLPAWIELSLQEQMNHEKQKMLWGRYLPSFDLYGFLGAQYYDENFSPLTNEQRWFGQSYIGLSMNLPLFEGGKKKRNRQALIILEKNIATEKERLEKEISQRSEIIKTEFALSHQKADLTDTELKRATGKLNDAAADYKTGITSYSNVLRADLDMRLKKQEYVSALYDIMLRLIEYKQLVSVY